MSPAPGALSIEISMRDSGHGQAAIVALSGELDIATAPDLEQQVKELNGSPLARLVLDFRNLSFIDSTGLRVVLGIAEAASDRDTPLMLVRGPEGVQRVFSLTGADRELQFVDDLADADAPA